MPTFIDEIRSRAQLPPDSYEILVYGTDSELPPIGDVNKIYVTRDPDGIFRWNGAAYVPLGEVEGGFELGETATTAYRGDRGKIAFDHTSATNNPHATTATQVGAVPITRKINGKLLTTDISLSASDIGALSLNNIDIDPSMTANSDSKIPSQKAIKTYISSLTHNHDTQYMTKNVDLEAMLQTSGSGIIRKTNQGTWVFDTNSYLTNINKSMVEEVLKGTIVSHNHDGAYEPSISIKQSAFNVGYETSVAQVKSDGVPSLGARNTVARGDHVHPSDPTKSDISHTHNLSDFPTMESELAKKANINSPIFTGLPQAPTPPQGTSSAQIATTSFVTQGLAGKANATHSHEYQPYDPDLTALASFSTYATGIPKRTGSNTWVLDSTTYIPTTQKGENGGVAPLDDQGLIPSQHLPSYMDEVIEYPTEGHFPQIGSANKIYIAQDTNFTYRWGGTIYVPIGTPGGIALGETSATAYRGDRGKAAYDHSLSSHAPATAQKNSDITKGEIEAKLTGVISSHTHSSGVPSPHASTHISGGADTIPNATSTNSGLLSAADKAKLDGIASEANKYIHPSSDGYHHVPATGTSNNQKVLKSGATAGSEHWGTISFSEITNLPSTLAAHGITDAAPLIHSHNYLSAALKGASDGVAELDSNGKVPVSQLPSVAGGAPLLSEITIDVAKDWGGRKITNVGTPTEDGDVATKAYVDTAGSLTLGETETTAYWGDKGKIAYDHSQVAHAPATAQKNVQSDWNATEGDALILNKPAIPSEYTLPTASAETLGGVKIGSGITITDGVISAAGGGSSIGWTAETAFTATPASTSTLTMTADKTGSIKVGMALKYTISSVVYYGIVTAITSNLLTIAGAPMGGDVTALYYSTNPAQVVQVDFFVTGKFADAANTGLLSSVMNTKFDWNLQEARLVQIRHTVKVDDSGANQPRVNLSVDGSVVSTSNSNAGVAVAETWSSTVVDINTTNYVVARDAAIEIVTDANGSNDDAEHLTVSGVFVII